MRRPWLPLILCVLAIGGGLPAAALDLTPSQTEGPYYPARRPAEVDPDLTRIGAGKAAKGDTLAIKGRVVDAAGKPVAGAKVEIWQADAGGIYMHPGDRRTAGRDPDFQFYGETVSDAAGAFAFRTIVPGEYDTRPRHIHARITPPGAPALTTQLYFKDDPRLSRDGIARSLGRRIDQLLLDAKRVDGGSGGALEASISIVVATGKPR